MKKYRHLLESAQTFITAHIASAQKAASVEILAGNTLFYMPSHSDVMKALFNSLEEVLDHCAPEIFINDQFLMESTFEQLSVNPARESCVGALLVLAVQNKLYEDAERIVDNELYWAYEKIQRTLQEQLQRAKAQ